MPCALIGNWQYAFGKAIGKQAISNNIICPQQFCNLTKIITPVNEALETWQFGVVRPNISTAIILARPLRVCYQLHIAYCLLFLCLVPCALSLGSYPYFRY